MKTITKYHKYKDCETRMAELLLVAKEAFGHSHAGVLRYKGRVEPLASQRACVFSYANQEFGLNPKQIAEGMSNDRTKEAVRHKVEEHEGRYEVDGRYRESYDHLVKTAREMGVYNKKNDE